MDMNNQIIIVLSRFQSALCSANKLANCTVERIHLYQWSAGSYAQAQGHVVLPIQLSSQKVDSCL
jgi:hypothetical protein